MNHEYDYCSKKSIGKRIRQFREAQHPKMSRDALAREMHYPVRGSAIANYETGVREPTAQLLARFSKVFGVHPSILAFGTSPNEIAALNPDEANILTAFRELPVPAKQEEVQRMQARAAFLRISRTIQKSDQARNSSS